MSESGLSTESVTAEAARLPQLLDCRAVMSETGLTRAAAEKLMRQIPIVMIDDLRKVYVRREDVLRYLDSHTYTVDQSGCWLITRDLLDQLATECLGQRCLLPAIEIGYILPGIAHEG